MGVELFYFFMLVLLLASSLLKGAPVELPLVLLAMFLAGVLLRERNERIRNDFINQLKSHRRDLRRGGTVVVDGLLLRYDTVVTFYVLSVGTLLTNINIRTPFRPLNDEAHTEGMFCSLASLLTGWWSVIGPPSVVGALLSNASGGIQAPIYELIDAERFKDSLNKPPRTFERTPEPAKPL